MFDKDRFIQDCKNAVAEGQKAIRELVEKAVCDSAAVMSGIGEPEHAGITTLYRSQDLTILNFVWAPCMSLMPHNHQMFSVIGIYSGREDNVFWRRKKPPSRQWAPNRSGSVTFPHSVMMLSIRSLIQLGK
jgi:predicted metal-dependent enzyme (double-stranded beta helix superfamily)